MTLASTARRRVGSDEARFAFGQRAGFVHDEQCDFLEPLQGLGALHQHAGAARRGRRRP